MDRIDSQISDENKARETCELATLFGVDLSKHEAPTHREKILRAYEEKSEEECEVLYKVFELLEDPVHGKERFRDLFENILAPTIRSRLEKIEGE